MHNRNFSLTKYVHTYRVAGRKSQNSSRVQTVNDIYMQMNYHTISDI